MGAVPDFEPIDYIVVPVDIEALVTVRGVPSLDDRSAPGLGLEYDRTDRRPAVVEVNPPAAGVVGIDPGQDVDRGASRG